MYKLVQKRKTYINEDQMNNKENSVKTYTKQMAYIHVPIYLKENCRLLNVCGMQKGNNANCKRKRREEFFFFLVVVVVGGGGAYGKKEIKQKCKESQQGMDASVNRL